MLKQFLFLVCFIILIGNICSQSVAVLTINTTNSKGDYLSSKLAPDFRKLTPKSYLIKLKNF